MTTRIFLWVPALVGTGLVATLGPATAAESASPVGVVSHVKVLSDKVPDVSSLEAWKQSFIKEGMSDEQKAIAAWKSSSAFVYQDPPPIEYLHEGCVHDTIKSFNVYGYGMCCCASARLEQLARYLGLQARGFGINAHSVPEIGWDNQWHLFDASLVNYFTRPDGQIASLADITNAVQSWLADHPECKGNAKLLQFQQADGWTGWKKGPALLSNCKFYDWSGWWPAKTHGWYSTMQEYDGSHKTPFAYEYGYSQGYEVNIQLRRGERLTRNWFNRGLHVNGILKDGDTPGCMKSRIGEGSMAFLRKEYGDLMEGRIGSGTLEYELPLADGSFRQGMLAAENIACQREDTHGPAVHLKDPGNQGFIELDMPCSYVYLTGRIALDAVVGAGGKIRFFFSDNHGLNWREVATIDKSGPQELDLQKFALRRYDYRLRVVLDGAGTGLERLKIAHDVQCSQRALPTLARGENTITFSAGPQEGTVTVEGSTQGVKPGKQVTPMDFHPVLKEVEEHYFRAKTDGASVTFPITTPGDLTRLRLGGHYRLRDKRDQWEVQVSFDGGQTFKTVDTQTGPYQGICKYTTVSEVPPGTRSARVRWVGTTRNTTCLFLVRIDADYRQPQGGFSPVKVTYVWEEGGLEKKDVRIAKSPRESYSVTCAGKPQMKSIALELAE
jgi:hypothetical protein